MLVLIFCIIKNCCKHSFFFVSRLSRIFIWNWCFFIKKFSFCLHNSVVFCLFMKFLLVLKTLTLNKGLAMQVFFIVVLVVVSVGISLCGASGFFFKMWIWLFSFFINIYLLTSINYFATCISMRLKDKSHFSYF